MCVTGKPYCVSCSVPLRLVSVSLEQQSVHAKEATEDMEVAILKTCQSVGDLRREVSISPPLLCLSAPRSLTRCTDLQKQIGLTWMSLTYCSAPVAGFPFFFAPRHSLLSSPAAAVNSTMSLCQLCFSSICTASLKSTLIHASHSFSLSLSSSPAPIQLPLILILQFYLCFCLPPAP